MMSDENLRQRFRRDFTKEPININQPKASQGQMSEVKAAAPTIQPAESDDFDTLPELNIVNSPPRPLPRAKRNFKKPLLIFLCLTLVSGGVTAGIIGLRAHQKPKEIVPLTVKSQISIPLLYPDKLPPGFSVVDSSFNVTNAGSVVAYYATDSQGNHLNFTVQARPANFDFNAFYTKILSNTTRFTTPLGEAAIGTGQGHLLGSLATSKSWVIITGNNKNVTADKIQTALSGLRVINN